jgi:hypothetical protein
LDSKDKERIFAESSVHELKEYLLSPTLFWPLSLPGLNRDEQTSIPKLTPGNLYLCLRKLDAYDFAPDLMVGIKDIEKNILLMLNDWQSSWKKKAKLEFPIRINLWESYLKELKRNPTLNMGSFSYQVRNRIILDLLEEKLKVANYDELVNIRFLDESLKNLITDSDFIWEYDLISGFPKNPYWYLYIKF